MSLRSRKNSNYEPKRRNPITLGDDSNIDNNLKPIKVDSKNTILELSKDELKVRGTIDASAITVDGASVQTGSDATGATELNDLSDVTYSSGDLTISSLDKIISTSIEHAVTGDFEIDATGDITLDAAHDDIFFKDNGVEYGKINMTTGSTLSLYSTSNYHLNLISQGAGDIVLDSGGDVVLDSADGNFIAKKAGTEFSVANSAYAGMILGYTDIGLDETHASYNLTTSFVVPTDEWGVTFTAPPSGNVEIMTSFQFYAGSTGGGDLSIGLSTANATSGYSALADFHEEVIVDQSGRHNYQLIHKTWTLTGLTAGTSYTYYVGVLSSSTSGTPNIKWGGDSASRYPDFIMKATALPATIST